MQLTDKEARYLIRDLSEQIFWSDDPLHECSLISSSILQKLVDEYPQLADSVREEREMEKLQHIEAHKQQMKNNEEEN